MLSSNCPSPTHLQLTSCRSHSNYTRRECSNRTFSRVHVSHACTHAYTKVYQSFARSPSFKAHHLRASRSSEHVSQQGCFLHRVVSPSSAPEVLSGVVAFLLNRRCLFKRTPESRASCDLRASGKGKPFVMNRNSADRSGDVFGAGGDLRGASPKVQSPTRAVRPIWPSI